jgi:hypothetical protein
MISSSTPPPEAWPNNGQGEALAVMCKARMDDMGNQPSCGF